MAAAVHNEWGISELKANSSEKDTRKTYDTWAKTYEEVCHTC